jgi:phosphoadenosine phosphosulfate reductase
LRLPVQAVYKFDDRRIVAGRLQSGRIAVGDEVAVAPSGKRAVVRSIETWPANIVEPSEAVAGQSVGIVLDRELFIARGDMIALPEQPAPWGRRLRARIFWLHDAPLAAGASVSVRIGAAEVGGTIVAIANTLDPGDQSAASRNDHREIGQNHVGEVEIALSDPVVADRYEINPRTGRVVLEYGGRIAGGGLVLTLDRESVPATSHAAKFQVLTARAAALGRVLAELNLAQRLSAIREAVDGRIVFTTSFGLEDQVILHHICEAGLDIDIVTLDTGRLFPETYTTWEETERRYSRRIRAVYPEHGGLERLLAAQGINGFYDSKEARVACCDVRKVEPLGRALADAQGWITGLRADQSAARGSLNMVAADSARSLLKFNPLIDWTRQAAQDFAATHQVPINPLHQKGFLSIGCAPCTRAVRPGESERAGRWWWEDKSKKECGLHVATGGVR